MNRTRTGLLFLCAAIALSVAVGCARGQKFDYHKIDMIQEGVTTQDDCLKLFGGPYRVRKVANSDGLFMAWDYLWVPGEGEGAALEVYFDEKGIVYTYEHRIIRTGEF